MSALGPAFSPECQVARRFQRLCDPECDAGPLSAGQLQAVFPGLGVFVVDDRRAKAWEAKLALAMQKNQVLFRIDLGLGRASTQWFGGDLSREYIAINADYTT